MTPQEILVGNKLINEFMQGYVTPSPNINRWLEIISKGISIRDEELKYHESWDWLMPVINKCYKLQDGQGWTKSKCLQYFLDIRDFMNDNALETVYEEIIIFIKWYNEQK